jgi:hypothetical protein
MGRAVHHGFEVKDRDDSFLKRALWQQKLCLVMCDWCFSGFMKLCMA